MGVAKSARVMHSGLTALTTATSATQTWGAPVDHCGGHFTESTATFRVTVERRLSARKTLVSAIATLGTGVRTVSIRVPARSQEAPATAEAPA